MAVDARLPNSHRGPTPKAQFRCDVCQRFVLATAHGVCPSCGREPLILPNLSARAKAGRFSGERLPWIYVLGVALALFFLAMLAY